LKLLARLGHFALAAFGLATLCLSILALAAPFGWVFALIGAWDHLVAAAALLGAAASLIGRWRALAALNGLAALVLIVFMVRVPTNYVPTQTPKTKDKGQVHLIWANVHLDRDALKRLASLKVAAKPQVIGLAEVPPKSDLRAHFPQFSATQVNDTSKVYGVETIGCPTQDVTPIVNPASGRRFGLKAKCPGYTLFVLHLQNPTRDRGLGLLQRDQELRALSALIQGQSGPLIVMGDFNATPSALPFYRLLTSAKLTRIACGAPSTGTWRPIEWAGTNLDYMPGFKLSIDHVLVRDVAVLACRVGPDVGSDHLPLIVTISPS
jgi:endonuclease/exonuclease/phosphatase (EEP) superfamily protein YafD